MAQTLKLIRKKDEITALNGKVVDSLDSNSTTDAPSIRAVNDYVGNMSNPNLLINGDFRSPINQRGKTTYTSDAGNFTRIFTVDRWNMQNGTTCTVNSASITLKGNSSASGTCIFSQVLEYCPIGDYTLQINVLSATNGSEVSIMNRSSQTVKTQTLSVGLNTFTVTNTDILIVALNIGSTSTLEIEYVKLEAGTVATPFVPRLVAEELALCQRYYEKRTILFFPYGGATPTTYFIAVNGDSHHVPKRVTPTLTVSALTDHNNDAISSNYVSATQNKDSIRVITVDPAYDKWLIRTNIEFDAEIY